MMLFTGMSAFAFAWVVLVVVVLLLLVIGMALVVFDWLMGGGQ